MDYKVLGIQLIELVASARYAEMNPVNSVTGELNDIDKRKEQIIHMYLNDPVSHSRINLLVSMILSLIKAAEKEEGGKGGRKEVKGND